MIAPSDMMRRFFRPLSERGAAWRRRTLFWSALREVERRLPVVPDSLLADLRTGWGNEGWSAGVELLQRAIEEACRAPGLILECGSGLTTVLLGLAAARNGNRVRSFEHEPAWVDRVTACLAKAGIRNVDVCLRPLRSHGGFSWYDVSPADLEGPIAMIVCDGPPEGTPGCRSGLLPVMRSAILPGAVLLLDDYDSGGRDVLNGWQRDFGLNYTVEGSAKRFGRAVWTAQAVPAVKAS